MVVSFCFLWFSYVLSFILITIFIYLSSCFRFWCYLVFMLMIKFFVSWPLFLSFLNFKNTLRNTVYVIPDIGGKILLSHSVFHFPPNFRGSNSTPRFLLCYQRNEMTSSVTRAVLNNNMTFYDRYNNIYILF